MLNLSEFSERLGELIFYENSTLSDIAAKIGCSQSGLSKYVAGVALPTVETAIKTADYFHCTLDYLFGLKEQNEAANFNSPPPFAERFESVLAEKNMSRYKLGKLTGIPESVMRYWVRGKTKPSIANLILIAEELNISLDYLLGREK